MPIITFSKPAEKAFFKLKVSDQKKISKAINKLIKSPLVGEKLKGELESQYKLYAWPYRIIYIFSVKDNLLEIVAIGHRQGIYK